VGPSEAPIHGGTSRIVIRDPLDDARAAGLRVEVAELGSWSPVVLVSEYDRAAATIRVSASVVQAVLRAGGEDAAEAFMRSAVAHELYHHDVAARGHTRPCDRRTIEADAHAFARAQYGADPERVERVLR
jgi:predicted signal transduction protein with EAL and GGDEF domain